MKFEYSVCLQSASSEPASIKIPPPTLSTTPPVSPPPTTPTPPPRQFRPRSTPHTLRLPAPPIRPRRRRPPTPWTPAAGTPSGTSGVPGACARACTIRRTVLWRVPWQEGREWWSRGSCTGSRRVRAPTIPSTPSWRAASSSARTSATAGRRTSSPQRRRLPDSRGLPPTTPGTSPRGPTGKARRTSAGP
jgi:hypothetical protein